MPNWATPDLDRRILELWAAPTTPTKGMWQYIRGQVDLPAYVSTAALRMRAYRLKEDAERGVPLNDAAPEPPPAVSPTDEIIHQRHSPTPLSEADMVALFRVDLTRWQVIALEHRTYHAGAKGPDGEIVTAPLYITRLRCKPLAAAADLTALTASLLQSLRDVAPPGGPFVITKAKAPEMLELCRPDLHWGKLGWSAETEAPDYDLTIARHDFHDAAADLFAKTAGYHFARIIIPSGNDEQHTDNLRSETTSGTRVDSDSRFHKMFRVAVEERIWLIREALQRAPEVWDVTISGNHDRVGAFTVGEVVRAYFSNEPRVRFDNEPPLRKYVRWGKTLLGYTHGSEEKHADLPLIMAQERPQDWAETLFRAWRLGHLHKRRQTRYIAGDSHMGVEVRVIASLSGTDAWHYQKGFVKQRRAMEAFVHHLEDGEVGAFLSRLPETQ